MSTKYNAIVIGSGHNALTNAAYPYIESIAEAMQSVPDIQA